MQVGSGHGSSVAWSHDGKMIAVSGAIAGDPYADLAVVPVGRWREVTAVFRLTSVQEYFPPRVAWSPDDTEIGFTLGKLPFNRDGPFTMRMARVNWRKGSWAFLYAKDAQFMDWSLHNRILAGRDRSSWMLDLSSGQWEQLYNPDGQPAGYYFGHWASDDRLMVLYNAKEEPAPSEYQRGIYLVDWTTNQWERLALEIADYADSDPVISSDGRWVAWIEYLQREDGLLSRIMLHDRQTGTTAEVANSQSNYTQSWHGLTWAPDSKRLAFVAEEWSSIHRRNTVWILTLDGPR